MADTIDGEASEKGRPMLEDEDREAFERYRRLRRQALKGWDPGTAHWRRTDLIDGFHEVPRESITVDFWREHYDGLGDGEVLEVMRGMLEDAAGIARRAEEWYDLTSRAVEAVTAEDPDRYGPLAEGYGAKPLNGPAGIAKLITLIIARGQYLDSSPDGIVRAVRVILDNEEFNREKKAERTRATAPAVRTPAKIPDVLSIVTSTGEVEELTCEDLEYQFLTDREAVGNGGPRHYFRATISNGRDSYHMILDMPDGWGPEDNWLENTLYAMIIDDYRKVWDEYHPGVPWSDQLTDRYLPYRFREKVSRIAQVFYCIDERPTKAQRNELMVLLRKHGDSKIKMNDARTGEGDRTFFDLLNFTTSEAGAGAGKTVYFETFEVPYQPWAYGYLDYTVRLARRLMLTPDYTPRELKDKSPEAWAKAEEFNLWTKGGKKPKHLGIVTNIRTVRMKYLTINDLGLGGNKSLDKYRHVRCSRWDREALKLDANKILGKTWDYDENEITTARKKHLKDVEKFLTYLIIEGAVLDFVPVTDRDEWLEKNPGKPWPEGRRPELKYIAVLIPEDRNPGMLYMADNTRASGE